MFRKNISTPSSRYISKPSKKLAEAGGDLFLRDVYTFPNYTALQPRCIATAVRMSYPTNRRMSTSFHVLRKYCWNQNSSVGIATRLVAD
jgi:hypothetical protein